ncbi:MAG: hypothetical protein DWQ10_11345 [Calditrichaeota bacterium]|nr:MAG: hypothetical protein DWQ10_11345 [Calditrichota bacterium]
MLISLFACQTREENPAAEGFDLEGSDPKAITIADEVMKHLGGRQNWDNTRYISWNFFGRRLHVWDKFNGNIRIQEKNVVTLMNINSKQGRIWRNGIEITEPDSLINYLDRGYSLWINDSYWLVMPYKLKDSGVTLKYLGEKNMETGEPADVLQLTFSGVGVTPTNKYDVYVNKTNHRVEQWSYYTRFDDAKPRITNPWTDWQQYGKIWLSSNRGKRSFSQIAVFDQVPKSVFEKPEPIDVESLGN